jgi:hypothetical protein
VTASEDDMLATLEQSRGRLHARQRLGIEKDHEAQIFGQGLNFFHLENATLSHSLIRTALMATGLYWRGLSNSAKVELRHDRIVAAELPASFDGFTILQISDPHVDMSHAAIGPWSTGSTTTSPCSPATTEHRPSVRTPMRWRASAVYARTSKAPYTACSAIMTRSAWCRRSRRWAYEC